MLLCAAGSALSVVVLVSIGQTQLGSNNKASVQLIASFLGIMLAVIFSTVDYRALARAWPLHATVAWGLVLPTLVFINIWFGAPMIMVNVYAALQTVPQDQYEAALIDGASSWQSFIHITVPHIKVVVGLLVVLRTIWVFNNFDIIFMTTAGGPASMTTTMPLYIYDLGWTNKLVGRASAASIILLAFLIAVCLIYFAVITHWEKEDQA